LAILDINLGEGQPSGLDAYHWLRESGFEGKIVFLTGHARSHPLVSQARQAGKVVILEKPTTMERLLSMLE
jgi:FixJ family two-component response regulator